MTARAIIISPHLDDAALSCGGGIARLVRAGVPVIVVTVFTADQPEGVPLSPLARRTHASWGIGDQPFGPRRAEDVAGLGVLGAEPVHLGLLDAIYRRSPEGAALYADPLVTPAEDDVARFLPRIVDALRDPLASMTPETRVFCPAGTCGHVDHVLVRRAVGQLVGADAIVTYDEYPYSTRPGAAPLGPDDDGASTVGTLVLTADELEARIAAIGCYVSQLRGLFPSEYERLREIASARVPVLGRLLVRPPDAGASRPRMAARVRRDVAAQGGERYRWSARRGTPFPDA